MNPIPRSFPCATRQLLAFVGHHRGESIAAAARRAGVGRTTVHRWMRRMSVQAALARHAQEHKRGPRALARPSVEAAARNVHQAVKQDTCQHR